MTAWNATTIAAAVARQTFQRRCLLLVDNCNWTGHECDVLGVTMDLRIIDVEIKISRADLKADAGKDKWWHYDYGQAHRDPDTGCWVRPRAPRDHPPRVWKHYFAMPATIWRPELLDSLPSPACGVLLMDTDRHGRAVATCVRRAAPNKSAPRLTAEQVVNIARLANLRMWAAYEARDRAVSKQYPEAQRA